MKLNKAGISPGWALPMINEDTYLGFFLKIKRLSYNQLSQALVSRRVLHFDVGELALIFSFGIVRPDFKKINI